VVNAALDPVVVTASVEVPEPLDTEDGLNEHAGGLVVATEPLSVMLLQERATLWLNPPMAARVMVEVAELPAETEAGDSAAAETVKLGGAWIIRLTEIA